MSTKKSILNSTKLLLQQHYNFNHKELIKCKYLYCFFFTVLKFGKSLERRLMQCLRHCVLITYENRVLGILQIQQDENFLLRVIHK